MSVVGSFRDTAPGSPATTEWGEYQYQCVSHVQREIGSVPVVGASGYTTSGSPAQGKTTGTEQGINAMNRAEEDLQRACTQGNNGDGES